MYWDVIYNVFNHSGGYILVKIIQIVGIPLKKIKTTGILHLLCV